MLFLNIIQTNLESTALQKSVYTIPLFRPTASRKSSTNALFAYLVPQVGHIQKQKVG